MFADINPERPEAFILQLGNCAAEWTSMSDQHATKLIYHAAVVCDLTENVAITVVVYYAKIKTIELGTGAVELFKPRQILRSICTP